MVNRTQTWQNLYLMKWGEMKQFEKDFDIKLLEFMEIEGITTTS